MDSLQAALGDEYFAELNLAVPVRQEIARELEALRDDSLDLIIKKIEQGQRLIRIKERIGHGNRRDNRDAGAGFLEWIVRSDVGFESVRSAERAMVLAESLFDKIDDLRKMTSLTKVSALYELTRSGYERVLDTALVLMRAGVTIEPKMAQMLTRIQDEQPSLIEKITNGSLTIKQAYEAAIAARYAPKSVQAIVEQHNVTDVPLIAALQNVPRPLLDGIAATGAIYNPNLQAQVPLERATLSDLAALAQVDEIERARRQQEHIQAWRDSKPAPLAKVRGTPETVVAELQRMMVDAATEYLVLVYPAPVNPLMDSEPQPDAAELSA